MTLRLVLTLSSLVMLLSGCGFHLRSSIPVAHGLQRVYMTGVSPDHNLYQGLETLVTRSGGMLVAQPELADVLVRVKRMNSERRTLSLSVSGKTSEFDLYFRVSYDVVTPQGKVIVPLQEIEIQRDYFNDQLAAIGKSEEEGLMYKEMAQEVAEGLFRRLSYALRNQSELSQR